MGKSKELAELGQVVSQNGGNVGIGTNEPAWPMSVQKSAITGWQYYAQEGITSFGAGIGSDAAYNTNYFGPNTAGVQVDNTTTTQELRFVNRSPSGAVTFRTGASNPLERMKIDGSGRVTMPYQPSFMVRPTDGLKYSGQGFTTVDSWTSSGASCHNVGGHMGSTYFTAPVAGRYYFHASLLQDPGVVKNWIGYAYYVNNYLAVDVLGLNAGSYIYERNSGSVIFNLQAGDTVHIAIRDDGGDGWIYPVGASASPYSWFTGYLIG